jgi:pyridoxal phosphate enzyme (YggS family)
VFIYGNVKIMKNNIASLIDQIRLGIEQATLDTDRNADDVTLIAVSKKQPDDRIDAALEAGLRVFGENRVQEAQMRWTERRKDYPDLRLHLIGPLQTNKAGDAVALFDVIETLDREKLAVSLACEMQKQNLERECLIQVNTGDEDQKAGITPEEAVAFSRHCRQTHGLNVTGMMCIPPVDEEPAMHFALLKTLAAEAGLDVLSMGMSGDYKTAIRFGATHIRVGSSLFGTRLMA